MTPSEVWRMARFALASSTDRIQAWRSRAPRHSLAWPVPSADVAPEAVRLGAEFLQSCQRDDGSLRGFQLTPGASVEWITAHVALVTMGVDELADLRSRAAEYLLKVGPLDGGWGYNRRVGRDLDSTLQALLVIESEGLSAPRFLNEWVKDSQRSDGSYPTYVTDAAAETTGWHAAHPDVTQMAAWYFRRMGDEAPYRKCLEWLERFARRWERPSYWWPGYGYSLWMDRQIEPDPPPAHRAEEELAKSHSAPQSAFALAAAVGIVDRNQIERGVTRLLAQQLTDGSWWCDPCLRVTSRTVHEAAPIAPGLVAPDPYRVFSTAHCVASISAAHRWLRSS
ncbi:MAG: terpene cyclase/mutase family protein [Acidimicrobiia bacterium]|nr:terpene cyclase/mutase family protein [Acidimicrobiia bacterium]